MSNVHGVQELVAVISPTRLPTKECGSCLRTQV